MTENGPTFCSDIAREHNLPLHASATRGDLWLMIEYDSPWEGKAFEQSTLPENVKEYLQGIAIPGAKTRIQMIRQESSRQRVGIRFFMAHTDPLSPRLFEFELNDYLDLLDLNLSALAAGDLQDDAALRDTPLYLVCTNGKRDLCCARYGVEIYNVLNAEIGEAVWQSSHIGGHNKAPNTLFFPYGVEYGHTSPEDILRLVHNFQQGLVGLEHYRGRVCFDEPAQAAEHFWRQETGNLDLPGMRLVSLESIGEAEWQVVVESTQDTERRVLTFQRRESNLQIPITCAQDKLSPISTFHKIDT
ncbi:MAG TPA: hypothetical protein DCY42_02275 [Chloroflexi bacterium]|nr:hypothetical protein [Chloroflexota bacterium]